jgi:hypothetical protein
MRWDRKARTRLAKIIWDRGLQIDSEERAVSRGLDAYIKARDLKIALYFENLGFSRASAEEWIFDPSDNFPPLFKPRKNYLCFVVNSSMVFKVSKDKAAKMLVLGMP